MIGRPQVIAFDVVETLFPLEPLRQRLVDAGQPPGVLELWFARLLRDGFALAASGGYRPFAEVAVAALASVTRDALTAQVIDGIVAGFAELDPRPEVDPALRRAVDSGVQVIALTNGSERNTRTLLHRAGVERHVPTVLSVDGVRRWKPAPEVYQYAAAECGVLPGDLALVAAHSWDTHGARRAGLATGWVSYLERRYPPIFDPPDVSGDTLVEVVDGLLAGP